jgi:class 3 adenylate cyclase
MQADAVAEVPVAGANALVAHLRQYPEEARRHPGELAELFELEEELVQNVLEGLSAPQESHSIQLNLQGHLWTLRRVWERAERSFMKATAKPILFVVLSTIASLLLGLVVERIGMPDLSLFGRVLVSSTSGWLTLLVTLTVALQMGCYYTQKMTRVALYGALSVWLILAPTRMVSRWVSKQGQPPFEIFTELMLVAFALFVISAMYAGFGSLASILGAYRKFRRLDRIRSNLTRQEMIERYFELQKRLAMTPTKPTHEEVFDLKAVQVYQQSPFGWSFASGFLITFLLSLVLASLGERTGAPGVVTPIEQVLMNLSFLLTVLAVIAGGFFSKQWLFAFGTSVAFGIGSLSALMIPLGHFGPSWVFQEVNIFSQGLNAAFMGVLALIGFFGSTVQQRAYRETSLRHNDPATLMAEMVRIQWRLSNNASVVCVLFVDVARSSDMKASADPLNVEYSFREYQEWVESISKRLGGRVHNTAGDGAVVAFADCTQAFAAARRMQTDLDRFNRNVNRLATPFRLRIGLHTGMVAGELDKVQFAEVIDIAAHIQGVAPASGIAVSGEVAEQLLGHEFVPLAREVNGHKVLLALNPTED